MTFNNPKTYQPSKDGSQEWTDDDSISDFTKTRLNDAFMKLEMLQIWTNGPIIGPVEIANVERYAKEAQAIIQNIINK